MNTKTRPGSGSGSAIGSGSGSGSTSMDRKSDKNERQEVGSAYKGSEVSAQQTTDSAYGSLGNSTTTSHYNRSISSKSPGSNLSKSSASGLSGFECFNQGTAGTVSKNVLNVVVSVSMPATSGVDIPSSTQAAVGQPPISFKKSHKKSKKNLDRARGGKSSAGKCETSGVNSNTGNSAPTDTSKNNTTDQGNQNHASSSTQEDKAAKVAALSQALNYIDKFRRNQEGKDSNAKGPGEEEINDLATTLQEASQSSHKTSFPFVGSHDTREQITEVLDKEQAVSAGSGFCAAVSLKDGMVMCTTTSITPVLGYPKDMWNGRSFIDFVHPKDRLTFTNKITSGIVLPFGDQLKGQSDEAVGPAGLGRRPNTFFCRLRLYNGLRQGRYSVRTRKTKYNPFKLIVCFKDIDHLGPDDEYAKSPRSFTSDCANYGPHSVYVIITAIPLKSAFSRKDEKGPFHETFVTRHLANCNFSMVDEAAIPFIGYLPQDLEGAEIFSCYHTLDLPYLKEVYETIMAEQGKPFRSQPYRFKVRNGCYMLLETDWSCFINPWSKKLEFVIGKHTILQGPSNYDVFDFNQEEEDVQEEMTTPCTKIQSEIKMILTESVTRGMTSGTCMQGHHTSKRRKELASFMGSLLEEMAKVEATKAGISSENTSVIGNISLHNDYLSSESPPSYNQLNYNENLTRFFNSQPRTLTEKEAIESSFKEMDDSKIFGPNFLGESSRTATNSESGNGSSQIPFAKELSQMEQKAKKKLTEQDNIECDSGENGTSGGVSANDPHYHKRLRNIHGGSGDGSGSGELSGGSRGGSGNGSGTSPSKARLLGNCIFESYRPAILTEELLLVHNRGMEKKMIDSYKEGRKGEIRFLKSKFRNLRQSNHPQAQKRLPSAAQNQFQQFNETWRDKTNQRISKHCRIIEQIPTPTANAVTLWPPFSVATTKPEDTVISTLRQQPHPLVQHLLPQVVTPMVVTSQRQPVHHDVSQEANLYRNLIPAYYIPADTTTTTQASRGGFLVHHAGPSGQTFLQHPLTYVTPSLTRIASHPVYYPIGPQVAPISNTGVNRDPIITTESHQLVQPNPGVSHQPSGSNLQNCMTAGHQHSHGPSDRTNEVSKHKVQRGGQNISKFPNPSRTAFSPNSRATSVKAEPGSALESNIESIASASVKDKIMSPVFHSSLRLPNEPISLSDCTSSESSMFSLMKSSDDPLPSDNSNSSFSDANGLRGRIVERTGLQDPFWLKNIDVTPHLMYEYQIQHSMGLKDVLESDENRLSTMFQPPLVREQLDQLYNSLKEKGEKPRPLLDEEIFPSGLSMTSSESSCSSAENSNVNKRMKKWSIVEKYSIFYEADAPLPPPITSNNRKSVKCQSVSCSKKRNGRGCYDESSQKTNSSSSKDCGGMSSTTATSSAKVQSEGNSSEAQHSQSRTSTSLGSSSAITIESKKSSEDGTQAARGSTDEGIGSKESASLENDNTTDSKSEDSGRLIHSKVSTEQRKKRK